MTDQWQPSFLYAPGDVVQPRLTDPVTQDTLTNGDFEAAGGWDETGNYEITSGDAFEGSNKMQFTTGLLMALAATGNTDTLAISTDGISWGISELEVSASPVFLQTATGILEQASSLDTWMHVGSDSLPAAFGHISTDGGVAWSIVTPTGDVPGSSPAAFKWVPELSQFFYAAIGSGGVFRSSDGTAWTESTTSFAAKLGIAYSPDLGMLMATVSTGTDIYRSTDGGDVWTASSIGFAQADVIWCSGFGASGLWVAIESSGSSVKTSVDGITWSSSGSLPTGVSGAKRTLAYDPIQNRLVIVGIAGARAGYTTDGLTWTDATTVPALGWVGVTWDSRNNQFVACENGGASSSFMTSPDGDTWTERTTSTSGTGWLTLNFGASPTSPIETSENTARVSVTPGQVLTAEVKAKITGDYTATIGITWHGAADVLLSTEFSDAPIAGTSSAYRRISATFPAPLGAETASVVVGVVGTGDNVFFDDAFVHHSDPVTISEFLFKAVQAASGYSDSFEPTWPTVLGNTVVDNEVTWEAIDVNRVVWRSTPILLSGVAEPTFPATLDGIVADNTILWRAISRRVEDENCPNTKEVAIAASKVFAADKDIISFSATVNPLDWTTPNDAGYIPFGLNTYGSQDVSALGLYRSNLVAFNSKGFQMWQVDADPANFAILDAVPVGVYADARASVQPVSNDLVFLTEAGIRSMGIAGASTNLQAGQFGKQIDDLVLAKVSAGEIPTALFYPGQGQYWLIFEDEAFVLTMNGGKQDMSWSRYTFPTDIDDWTILDQDLYLRSGDEVWRVSPDAKLDQETAPGVGTDFLGEVWWHYLDFGGLGDQKMMHGFDLVGKGNCTITFGYDQSNTALVTAGWTVTDIDTLPGTMVPMPISGPSFQMRLSFSADQAWEWQAAAIYLDDQRTTS